MSLIGKQKLWIALALCAISSPVFAAQDHQHEQNPLEDVHARMKELMGKVESRLKSIDELLDDASARDKSLSPTEASAIDKVLVVSREALLRTSFSTVVCAPVYSAGEGLSTQVPVGPAEGLKHASWIMCDNLTSLRRSDLTDYVGSLPPARIGELNLALRSALDLA